MALTWPDAGRELIRELSAQPGRLALLSSASAAAATLERLAEATGGAVISIGRLLTEGERYPTDVTAMIGEATFLSDCDVLFSPDLQIEPLGLLRSLARRGPRVAIWPGSLRGNLATYSVPGRADYYEGTLSDAIILSPRQTAYPDEVPYTEERIP